MKAIIYDNKNVIPFEGTITTIGFMPLEIFNLLKLWNNNVTRDDKIVYVSNDTGETYRCINNKWSLKVNHNL